MGLFPQFVGHIYILLVIDYVQKWVEAISCMKNDVIIVSKCFKMNIFSRFGMLRALIKDEGSHFINRIITKLPAKYNINHKVTTAYHPQTNGQAKVSNREIKKIQEKLVNSSRKNWIDHLDLALWAYYTTYNTYWNVSLRSSLLKDLLITNRVGTQGFVDVQKVELQSCHRGSKITTIT